MPHRGRSRLRVVQPGRLDRRMRSNSSRATSRIDASHSALVPVFISPAFVVTAELSQFEPKIDESFSHRHPRVLHRVEVSKAARELAFQVRLVAHDAVGKLRTR